MREERLAEMPWVVQMELERAEKSAA